MGRADTLGPISVDGGPSLGTAGVSVPPLRSTTPTASASIATVDHVRQSVQSPPLVPPLDDPAAVVYTGAVVATGAVAALPSCGVA